MNVGDWVHLPHNGEKTTGFILGVSGLEIEIQVTIPNNKIIKVPKDILILGSSTIWMDDIPVLIDLALLIRDEEWFRHWVYEMSLWRPIEEFAAP